MRHPVSLHCPKKCKYDLPEQVVSSAKLSLSCTSERICLISRRPAAIATESTSSGESSRAISSAFKNACRSRKAGNNTRAAVVLPAPLGPPMSMMSFISQTSKTYTRCSTFFAAFLAAFLAAGLATTLAAFFAAGLAEVAFSTTGPCVSAVGRGGASPMRFE